MDQAGQKVMQDEEYLTAGVYTKFINTKHYSAGVYFVQVILNNKTSSARFMVTGQ